MTRGKFISVEGPDGAGKTTNLAAIERSLQSHDINVVRSREPGGTPLGEQVRSMLLEQHDLLVSPVAETLLIFAARAQNVAEIIEPALARGDWVLCDRFTDATRAYQGGGRQLDSDHIEYLARWVHKEQNPDLTLIFDVTTSVAEQRLGNDAADRFETQAEQFKERVRETYASLARDDPERIHLLNTDRDRRHVAQDVENIISAFIAKTRL